MSDKDIELNRYDDRSATLLGSKKYFYDATYGATAIHLPLRKAYLAYEEALSVFIDNNSIVLEIGAGIGLHTGSLLKTGATVTATDISGNSISIIKKRFYDHEKLECQVADMEFLPFKDESFDIVASAGCLSYGDNGLVMNEIYRVLKRSGVLIAIDSLNHNPVYKINRWVRYLRGHRTLSTLKRMPTIALIESYRSKFGDVKVQYFGSISWLTPLLVKILGDKLTAKISDSFDSLINVKNSAFKFVMTVKKI